MKKLIAGSLLAPALLLADFTYTETTRMTGGALMQMSRTLGVFSKDLRRVGEPVTSTVIVQGNRMAHVNDRTAQIWDLDKESITEIDFEKRTWSTITFAQMKEAMEKAMQRAQQRVKETEDKRKEAEQKAEVSYKMDVKETGKVQNINGVNAHEVLMTMTFEAKDKQSGQSGQMETMSSIWVTDSVPGYQELVDFQKRLALKMANALASPAMAGQAMMMASNPQFMTSMQKMAKEAEKLKGIHIKQITKMGMNLDPAKASEVTDPATMQQPQGPSVKEAAGDAATDSAASRIGRSIGIPGGLGGLGGFGRRKKKQEEPPPPPPPAQENQQAAAANSGVLMEMVMEMNNFSTAPADSSKFSVPAGFKQVDHPMMRALQ
ncbi:MAG: hypothetical protein IT165_03695 [Bryobacterales bacterium]|nr:hypothetical protein [Bryobacterales bacterium]